jgi:hypothetical protein
MHNAELYHVFEKSLVYIGKFHQFFATLVFIQDNYC